MRVAVVGSSYVGAMRAADAHARETLPDVEFAYFAMPGGAHSHAVLGADGRLTCPTLPDDRRHILTDHNGAEEFDTSGFDIVWLVGPRVGIVGIVWLLSRHAILGEDEDSGLPLITRDFAEASIRDLIDGHIARFAERYGADTRIVLTPAPHPARMASRRGPRQELQLARLRRRPYAADLHRHYDRSLMQAIRAQGWRPLTQPKRTLSGPFATKDVFLRDRPDSAETAKDLRHMNAAFGAANFDRFAAKILGLVPGTETEQEGEPHAMGS